MGRSSKSYTRAIMEAMAAGKPIIATNVRGNIDLVRDGVNGCLIPVNDIEKKKVKELYKIMLLKKF
jgi:glycosyltransferase involved in cell wall biosynthesis